MKLLVIGNAGSGKSTLSKQIAKYYKVDCYSLDKIVWKEHWQKTSEAEQKIKINKLIEKAKRDTESFIHIKNNRQLNTYLNQLRLFEVRP